MCPLRWYSRIKIEQIYIYKCISKIYIKIYEISQMWIPSIFVSNYVENYEKKNGTPRDERRNRSRSRGIALRARSSRRREYLASNNRERSGIGFIRIRRGSIGSDAWATSGKRVNDGNKAGQTKWRHSSGRAVPISTLRCKYCPACRLFLPRPLRLLSRRFN